MAGSGTTTIHATAGAEVNNGTPGDPTRLADTRTLLNNGELVWTGPLALDSTAQLSNHNTLTLADNASVTATTPIDNQGTLRLTGPLIEVNGPVHLGHTVVIDSASTLTVTGAVQVGTLILQLGEVNGPGTLTINTVFDWRAGNMRGTGLDSQTIVASGAVFRTASPTAVYAITNRVFTINGTRELTATSGNVLSVSYEDGHDGAFTNLGVRPASPPSAPAPFDAFATAGAVYRAMFGGATGMGTDEDAIYRVMENIRTTADGFSLASAYTTLYPGRNLLDDLQAELSGDAHTRAHTLFHANWTRYVAVSMYDAMYGWVFVDSDLIFRLLRDARTDPAAVSTQYSVEYPGRTLSTDFTSKLNADHARRASAILVGHSAQADAAAIHYELHRSLVTRDSEAVYEIFRTRTPTQIAAIRASYSALYNVADPDFLNTELAAMLPAQLGYVRAILAGDRLATVAARLNLAMAGPGTDEEMVWKALEGLYSDERARVAQIYHAEYGTTLAQALYDEFQDDPVYGKNLEKTLKLYANGGLTLAERIHYALDGWGTDDPEIHAAVAQLRVMTSEQIAAIDAEYRALSGGETLSQGLYGDLNGRDWQRAQASLSGRPSTMPDLLLTEAQRILDANAYETHGASNAVGNGVQWIFNSHGANLSSAVTQLHAARDAYQAAPTAAHETALRNAMTAASQHLTTFQEGRDAITDLTANALSTVVGIAAVIGSGGLATPIVVAVAAGVGGATQAIARMHLSGTFNWEQLPTDFVLGAVNAGTAALSFPAATRAAILSGTAQVGVLRQVAGSAFVGGAATGGLARVLSEDTWAEGFAPGVVNVAQAAAVSGFASTVLAGTVGAGVYAARSATPFVQRIATSSGVTVINILDAPWVQAGASAFRSNVQTIAEYLDATLIGWATKADDIVNRLLAATAEESEHSVRQGVQSILATTSWSTAQRGFVEEAAMYILRTERNNLGILGAPGILDRMRNGMRSSMMSMDDFVNAIETRLGIARADAEALAPQIQNADRAAIDGVLDARFGAANVTPEMREAAQEFVPPPRPNGNLQMYYDGYTYRGTVSGDPVTYVRFETTGPSEIRILGIDNRGLQPRGSAGVLLGETIRRAGLRPTVVNTNQIINEATIAELASGVRPYATTLGRTLRNAATELGAIVEDIVVVVDGSGNRTLRMTLRY